MKKILIAASIVFASLTSVAQKNERVEVNFKEVKAYDITLTFTGESNGKTYTFDSKKDFQSLPTNQKYTIAVQVNDHIPCMLFLYTDQTAVNLWYNSVYTGVTLSSKYGLVIHCE